MERITCTPKYLVENCSDLCGFLPRTEDTSGMKECLKNEKCHDCIILKAFQRLKEYEDTGLTPKQIHDLTIHTTMPKERFDRNGNDK